MSLNFLEELNSFVLLYKHYPFSFCSCLMVRPSQYLPFPWLNWAVTPRSPRCASTAMWMCSLPDRRTGGSRTRTRWRRWRVSGEGSLTELNDLRCSSASGTRFYLWLWGLDRMQCSWFTSWFNEADFFHLWKKLWAFVPLGELSPQDGSSWVSHIFFWKKHQM